MSGLREACGQVPGSAVAGVAGEEVRDRVIQESGWVDTGGGISALAVITIPDDFAKYIQFGANCVACKAHFWFKQPRALYCSGRCRTRAWRARRAGTEGEKMMAVPDKVLFEAEA